MASTRPQSNNNSNDNNNDTVNENPNENRNIDEDTLMAQRSFHELSNNSNNSTDARESAHVTTPKKITSGATRHHFMALRILDFPENVETIEDQAFYNCWSLRKLRIPPTVHSIGASAFANCWELRSIELPERIESSSSSVSNSSSSAGNLNHFLLKLGLCFHNDSSVAIQDAAFNLCHSLRNIALPRSMASDIDIPVTAFVGCAELKKHFPQEEQLMEALKHRFDGLSIHKLCYYQSHYPLETTIRNLETAIATERRQRQQEQANKNCHDGCGGVFGMKQNLLQFPWAAPTRLLETIDTPNHVDSQQDAFGMTPLHILTCSVRQSLDLYQLLIDYNPTDLITKDKWGDYPLLYAYQTHAPLESVMLLLQSQRRIFPDHKIEWVPMIKKMCVNHASVESIQMVFRSHEMLFADEEESEREKDENRINLRLCIQDRFWFWKLVSFPVLELLVQYQEANFPNDAILWDPLVERLISSPHWLKDLSMDKIVFLLKQGTAPRVAILGLEAWRDDVIAKINSADLSFQHQMFAEKRSYVKTVLAQLKHFELREMAALLELAMWNKELNQQQQQQPEPSTKVVDDNDEDDDNQDLDRRQECLVSCGAEVVIANVLPLVAKSPSKLAIQRRSRSGSRARGGRRRRRRRIVDYVMNEV
mmetsp:Transcript_24466/g.59908  ORF Transcript_24466/g.59908 Transcript_24466/m.59908 type:complete len:650 (-) Transcript_24466:639-2588(-)|eukprot:CAMPEP_0113640770 /NCGR_PEP_ID=MMETSP0017_2-20120614/21400_1 /TAXON_ID=2856 /ORGANISM="Cylindrotheca closterium" /LENGTH=649 /DNA_ID=CAMNT_0000552073 /DNA_START=3 /DNA_END=1952 /DNA_ORIENTATION=- /assembly_acc=CAM_ASM_000147